MTDPSLPAAFLTRPIAHRALHDAANGRPENSRSAVEAAVEKNFGIEIDVQLTADEQALVFHDYDLDRLTIASGHIRERNAADLATISLNNSAEGLPTLREILEIVAGRVPLLIELKDQDGALGQDVGPLEAAVAGDIENYEGPVAVMSFNPHSVSALQTLAPQVPRGLTTDAFRSGDWPVPAERLNEVAQILDYERVGASFISHNRRALDMPRVAELKRAGASILCWTVRSPMEEAEAREIADNITFEGYLPGPVA